MGIRRGMLGLSACFFAALLTGAIIHMRTYIYTAVQPAYRQLEGMRIVRSVGNFEKIYAPGFVIRYDEGDEAAALIIRDVSQAYGRRVLNFFNHQRELPVEIIVFPDEQSLKGALRIPAYHSAMGAYAGGKIHILSPSGFLGESTYADVLQNVFIHELAHLAIDDLAKGNYPMMFTEGLALYLEYVVLGHEWGSDLTGAHDFTAEDLINRFHALNEYRAYRASYQIVKGLAKDYGRMKLIEMLHTLGTGKTFEQSLTEVYGITVRAFNKYMDCVK